MLVLPLPKSNPQVCSHVFIFFIFTNNGGHHRSTLVSGLVLAVQENENGDEDEADGEVEGSGGGVYAL